VDAIRKSASETVPTLIIGAGIAGATTAAALARAGAGPGLILEREPIPGAHASGKNAGIACVAEFDPVVRALAVPSVRRLHDMTSAGVPILRPGTSVYLGDATVEDRFQSCVEALRGVGARAERLSPSRARERFPLLERFVFEHAMLSGDEGIIDIHALLLGYLDEARRGGFDVATRSDVLEIRSEHGRVTGVLTPRGFIRADVVIDAAGAWAGHMGRARALPLQPLRRHLLVTADQNVLPSDAPLIWHVSSRYYLRPEGRGLLVSPGDETPSPACVPQVDPAAIDLLAAKLAATAPSLTDLPVRSSWACLRTFASDRRPVIGWDPELRGLFHVSGLGGFGMGTSWAVGEVAAALVRGVTVPFVEPADVAPERLVTAPVSGALRVKREPR